MPHTSVRLAFGKCPPDLKREPWDPDRKYLERRKCKEILTKQKLLFCEPKKQWFTKATQSTSSDHPHTEPSTRKVSLNVQPVKEKQVVYRVRRTIMPENSRRGTFAIPDSRIVSADSETNNFEAVYAARNHLRSKLKMMDWYVVGVLSNVNHGERPHPKTPEYEKHWWSSPEPKAWRFVLVKRKYICSCEKSYHPRHDLKVDYQSGYTPASDQVRAKAYEKWVATEIAAAAAGGAAGAAAGGGAGGC